MLKLWLFEPTDGSHYVHSAGLIFEAEYEAEWIEEAEIREMIKDIDNSDVISGDVIKSPVLGIIPPVRLSGGVKTLIMASHDQSRMYNLTSCGDNCAKWVLKISEKKDLTVYLQHIMHFEGTFKIKIMNTGKIVCNPKDYVEGLLEAEEKEDERKLLVQSEE